MQVPKTQRVLTVYGTGLFFPPDVAVLMATDLQRWYPAHLNGAAFEQTSGHCLSIGEAFKGWRQQRVLSALSHFLP